MSSDAAIRIVGLVRAVNRGVGLVCGLALLATGLLILVEVVLRGTWGGALGGSDEIAGYVMAAISTWGFGWALAERAHVRIDLLQRQLAPWGRASLDALALLGVSAVATLVTLYAWSVLATTLERNSLANTPLETPLWIPQSLWLGGWAWFSLTAWVLSVCLLATLAVRRADLAEAIGGVQPETEVEP